MTKRYFSERTSPAFFDILKGIEKDDLVLLGLILFLIGDGCEDKELLLILGFLYISNKAGSDNGILSYLEKLFNTSS